MSIRPISLAIVGIGTFGISEVGFIPRSYKDTPTPGALLEPVSKYLPPGISDI